VARPSSLGAAWSDRHVPGRIQRFFDQVVEFVIVTHPILRKAQITYDHAEQIVEVMSHPTGEVAACSIVWA
jgi:hypothetical protein